MQKVVNVLAVSSAVVSLAVVGSVGYVFVNREAIVDDVKEQVLDGVLGGLGGGLGGAGGAAGDFGGAVTPDLGTGANDLDPTPQASAVDAPSF